MGFPHLTFFKPHNNPMKWKRHYRPSVVGAETHSEELGYFCKVSQPLRDKAETRAMVCPVPKHSTCNHYPFLPLTDRCGLREHRRWLGFTHGSLSHLSPSLASWVCLPTPEGHGDSALPLSLAWSGGGTTTCNDSGLHSGGVLAAGTVS